MSLACPHCQARSAWLPAPSQPLARLITFRGPRAQQVSELTVSRPVRRRFRARASATQQRQTHRQLQPQVSDEVVPPGCQRYSVTLSKPLGMVLEEDKHGNIYVAEVQEGGNAEQTGVVGKGDMLVATSGYTYSKETAYNDVRVRSGEKLVRLNVRNEDFSTVLAAIRSHPGYVKVKLEFQRCER